MSKFNVNDKVRVVKCEHGHGHEINEIVTIKQINYEDTEIFTGKWCLQFYEIEPVETGPIRTVTRREIVPGTYGIVRVSHLDGVTSLSLNPFDKAEELREAANTLTQIAEALEGDNT